MAGKSDQFSTINRKQRMLKALVACHGIVTRAAKMAGITPQTHYNWYKEDRDYQDNADRVKFECFEEFKDLVMGAVRKKIEEGNTTIIALCYKQVCAKEQEKLESLNPYRPKLRAVLKIAPHPRDMYSQDKMTQLAVKEWTEEQEKLKRGDKV